MNNYTSLNDVENNKFIKTESRVITQLISFIIIILFIILSVFLIKKNKMFIDNFIEDFKDGVFSSEWVANLLHDF